ncbi:NAD(P)/FAD-dependent oxidoreductase [Reyranella sp.]|uniref:NAD(P)/FAD-dependent oxidoreductase n=1 Tax=Reyranella sp. TaxID=1929291 RepID=UPI0027308720|nr:FAD-dependent oxidoreductase [Reyranella sp.]MDP2378758.1 FAD-dependent oxidoreductase [Reyranella sp.]
MVGAGPAGVAAALAAKRVRPEQHVLLFAEEDRDPYEKPPLSKNVLMGTAEPESKPIANGPTLAAAGVVFVRGARATKIDRKRREVHFCERRPVAYDTLVLATGARARTLPALPQSMANVHYLRTAVDALVLRDALRRPDRSRGIVVVGAGLIGLEAAAAAGGSATTVLETGFSAMARVCSADLAQIVIARHAMAGVRFLFRTTIVAASSCNDGLALRLSDGAVLEAGIAIVGIGAKPDIDLAVEAGLPATEGILVDDHCRTADPTIFAAGDVAQFRTRWCADPTRLENWRHALDQGQVAGTNAAGGEATYGSVPSFWSDQYELMIQGAGWPDGLTISPVRRTLGEGRVVEFHMHDGKVRYAVGIGVSREINIIRRLIEKQVDVTAQTLTDPAVSLQGLLRP